MFIIKLSRSLALPLSLIYCSFMSTGAVLRDWKEATVTPIFKGGIASDISNYRPISLTSIFSKIVERVVVSTRFIVVLSNPQTHK